MSRFAKLAPIVALLPAMATACTLVPNWDYAAREMTPDFSVTLTHQGKPLAGAAIYIYPENGWRSVKIPNTAADGSVHVTRLGEGNYRLFASYMGVVVDTVTAFHVGHRATSSAKRQLTIGWEDGAPKLRYAEGTYSVLAKGVRGGKLVGIASAKITLENAITHQTFSTSTKRGGFFSFGKIPFGTYLLRAQNGSEPPRTIVFILTLESTRESLHLAAIERACEGPVLLPTPSRYRLP